MQIIKFESNNGNKYMYDNNSGQIFNINGIDADEVKNEYDKKLGQYQEQPIKSITGKDVEYFLIDKGNGFHQLILEITSQCNFRCKYCCYSDHYVFTHGYSNDFMSLDTALQTVDMFFEYFEKSQQSNPLLDPFIGFYGGEPMLNFQIVKDIVSYIKIKYDKYETKFNITTNAYNMKSEDIDYLVENDFAVLISLDGNKENHDRNRLTTNNQPTFSVVMEKIKIFKEKYPNYSKLSISFCYDIKTNLIDVKNFFEKENIKFFRASPIESTNTNYYDQFTEEDYQEFQKNFKILKSEFIESVKNKTLTPDKFVYNFFCVSYLEFNYHCMIGDQKNTMIPYSGTCIPGQKMYVRPDGSIHICERINPNFTIGNVARGLDYNKIANLINEYNNQVTTHCSKCPTNKLCSNCFAKFGTDENILFNSRLCEIVINNNKEILKEIANIMESDATLFDNITVHYYEQLIEKAIGGC
jgi:uncharacterized protein